MLMEGDAAVAMQLLDATGLLAEVLPELKATQGVQQPPEYHPEGDVFTHTLKLLKHLRDPSPTLAMAALLHDVGKPRTQTFEDRIRFNRHEKVGADMSKGICERLRMSTHDTTRIEWLVGQHMRVSAVKERTIPLWSCSGNRNVSMAGATAKSEIMSSGIELICTESCLT